MVVCTAMLLTLLFFAPLAFGADPNEPIFHVRPPSMWVNGTPS
jgi:hypothetical protein